MIGFQNIHEQVSVESLQLAKEAYERMEVMQKIIDKQQETIELQRSIIARLRREES